MEDSMPEEQQKIVLHLCGCFMYVRICLEASKYTELGRFQDCFYIRSDPREDMGNNLPSKCISYKLLQSERRPVTHWRITVFFLKIKMIKTKQPKAQPASALPQSTVVSTHPDLHFLPPKTWRRSETDGVGENGSHDFQMEGLELREPDQQLKKARF